MSISYAVGMMSGTSMDGTDAVCVRFIEHRFDKVIAHVHREFDDKLITSLLALQDESFGELKQSKLLANTLTQNYIETAKALFRLPEMANIEIEAVGCHGQTVRHAPQDGYSIQLANWALLAEHLKLPVVGDFRAADIAAAGQGAPLVPAFHQMLFAKANTTRVVVNIGGIANITILNSDGSVSGFDTGPGNMLLDAFVRKYFNLPFDKDGEIAKSGHENTELLKQLLSFPYFAAKAPKSTGRDTFSLAWLEKYLPDKFDCSDIVHTLTKLTAYTITQAIQQYAPDCSEIILCGGGTYNKFLYQSIQQQLPNIKISNSGEHNLPVMQVESSAFAWLAHCRIHRIPANLPSATGAIGKRILGAVWDCC